MKFCISLEIVQVNRHGHTLFRIQHRSHLQSSIVNGDTGLELHHEGQGVVWRGNGTL